MTRPRLLSLCTGYGGLDHAAEDVFDAQLVAVSDIDAGANKILAHRYPDVPNLGDLKRIDWDAWAGVGIMTAGYPCQPFSHAGKRAGTDDPRHIFPWIVEGIRRLGPRLVLLENVRGHIVLGFPEVLGTLADIGYDARWVCLRASDVGACHNRSRLFIAVTPRDADGAGLEGWRQGRGRAGERTAGAPGLGSLGELTRLLPTPNASDWKGPNHSGSDAQSANGLATLAETALLPTPRATDGTKGGPNQRGSSGDLMLPSAVMELLPTPAVNDMGRGKTVEAWDEWTARMKTAHGNGNGHGPSLEIEAQRSTFGKYAAAIARQEAAFGHPAPPPTEPTGKHGAHRLSPRFVEWMQGCEPGWVTDVPGLTRNDQLKALGNGVVRQQAAAAIRYITQPLEAVA
jgi:DNA (cytosine-5)-methyltransferase 1